MKLKPHVPLRFLQYDCIKLMVCLDAKHAKIIKKLIDSAYSNAEVKAERTDYELDIERLVVQSIYVDEGPKLRRFRPRARGMAYRIHKKTSHITVVLATPEVAETAPATQKKASK